MDEKTAYLWAARCLEPIGRKCEPHLGQQVADKIASALLEATEETAEERNQLRAELAAVDESLGGYYIPVRDPETDEPGGAFYQDHGVWIVVEELAAHVRAFHLAAEELARVQGEVARLHKVNTALVAAMKMVRDYIARVHGEGLPRGAFGPVQLYQIMDGAVEDAR